jgi:hypothetical protein
MDCFGLSDLSHPTAARLYLWDYLNSGGHVSSEIGDFETLVDLPYQGLPGLIRPGVVDGSNYFHHAEDITQEQDPLDLCLTFDLRAARSSNIETSFYRAPPPGVVDGLPVRTQDESQNMQLRTPGIFFGTWSGDLCDSPLSSSNGSFPTSPELHSFSQSISQTSGYSETSFDWTVSNQNRVYASTPPQWQVN